MMPAVVRRQTADERRTAILAAAVAEFACGGLDGTSTEAIARRAGISQPYVFRLFRTKKELFLATVDQCFRETLEAFTAAAADAEPGDELRAMGAAYTAMLADRNRLRVQLQAYAACDDLEVRRVVRQGFGEVVEFAERVSGAGPTEVSAWVAKGMLLNAVAAMDLVGAEEGWATRLVAGCRE